MATWTPEQLNQIAAADELRITTPGQDAAVGRPVPIWVVRHGDALYIRSYRGNDGGWYRRARTRGRGSISANAMNAEVSFVAVTDDHLNAEIDAAYRRKYARYGPRFLDPMTAPGAQATTLKVVPA